MIALALAAALAAGPAHGQQDADIEVSDADRALILGGFAAAVAGLALFLARDVILRRTTQYDRDEMESKRDRTYEKYHSEWGDDYEEVGRRRNEEADRRVREAAGGGALPDYYGVLGVGPDATAGQIKARYRELAKRAHPDREGSADEMAEINEAYEVLSDDESRERYDRYSGAAG